MTVYVALNTIILWVLAVRMNRLRDWTAKAAIWFGEYGRRLRDLETERLTKVEAMKIWKYQFDGATSMWRIPKGAEILCVQLQYGKPCIWAKVDPDAEPETRMFQIHPTGQDMGSGTFKYVGTYQIAGEFSECYVWHVFEVLRA